MKSSTSSQAIIENLIAGLNARQKEAVTHPFTNHSLILAGAGCGKTAVLTRRVAYCTVTHCDQGRILALTFTRKAAEEMQKRLMSLPGISRNKPLPMITTFHGCGLHILKESIDGLPNYKRLGFTKEPALLSGRDRLILLSQISTLEQRRALRVTITDLDDLLSRQMVHPQKNNHLSDEALNILSKLAKCLAESKRERNCWEFSDMIQGTLRLFSEYPDVASFYTHKFNYILVDEFQDTNPLQVTMLKHFISPENRLFAVGDDDQAIYGFRGADIGPIMHFGDHFPGADIIKLETNYRSTPEVLKTANKIFKDKPALYRKVLISGKFSSDGKERYPRPVKKHFSNTTDFVQWIIDTGISIEKKEGIAFSDMALLFRLNESLELVLREIENRLPSTSFKPKCMTIHGSKGLEFPVVFLCDLEESIFPHYPLKRSQKIRSWADLLKRILFKRKKVAPQCDFDEEKRLFYVGVTRAERYLFLLSIKTKVINRRRINLKPSRFLKLV